MQLWVFSTPFLNIRKSAPSRKSQVRQHYLLPPASPHHICAEEVSKDRFIELLKSSQTKSSSGTGFEVEGSKSKSKSFLHDTLEDALEQDMPSDASDDDAPPAESWMDDI